MTNKVHFSVLRKLIFSLVVKDYQHSFKKENMILDPWKSRMIQVVVMDDSNELSKQMMWISSLYVFGNVLGTERVELNIHIS